MTTANRPHSSPPALSFQYWLPGYQPQTAPSRPAASVLLDLNQFVETLHRRQIRAAIFDMDGTLVDSIPYWQQLPDEFLSSVGISECPASIRRQVITMTTAEVADLFVSAFDLPMTPKQVQDQFNALMARHYQQDIPLKPFAHALLDTLERYGMTLCVASATDEQLASACLKRLGILDHFPHVLSCIQLSTSKSRPDIYLEACRRMNTTPRQTAVFEDALYALQTAQKADFCTIALLDPGNQKDRDQLQHTARFIADLDQGQAQYQPESRP